MDHQSLYYSISVGLNVILFIGAHQIWARMRRIMFENERMSEYIGRINQVFDDAQDRAREQNEERMNNPPPLPTHHQMEVDHQTFLLMHLATNNPNQEEAKTAAMIACARIMGPVSRMLRARS